MPATAATEYPTADRLRKLYPALGIHVLSRDDGAVKAVETINGKIIPCVLFTGADETEVEDKVLRLWHWEKTGKRLPLPFTVVHGVKPTAASKPIAPAPVITKVAGSVIDRVPNPAGKASNGGSRWAHHPVHGTKRHHNADETALVAAGWTIGRPKR